MNQLGPHVHVPTPLDQLFPIQQRGTPPTPQQRLVETESIESGSEPAQASVKEGAGQSLQQLEDLVSMPGRLGQVDSIIASSSASHCGDPSGRW